MALVALALVASTARADEIAAAAPAADETRLLHRGFALALGFESGTFGLASTAEVGFELRELRSTHGRRLLWVGELSAGPTGGEVANTYSPVSVLGARASGDGELDYRFLPERTWSPYAGGGGNLALSALGVPSTGFGGYDRMNSLDGIAGVTGSTGLRVAGGVSGLQSARAWQGGLFVQEELRAPTSFGTANLFTELGVHASYAAARGLWLSLDALTGRDREDTDRHLHFVSRLTHDELALSARQELGRFWLALDARVWRDSRAATFPGSALVFHTSGPVTGAAILGAGWVLP